MVKTFHFLALPEPQTPLIERFIIAVFLEMLLPIVFVQFEQDALPPKEETSAKESPCQPRA
jgi:hypothetical protein